MSQPTQTGMLRLLMARIVESRIVIDEPPDRNSSWTPCSARNIASVTTNDGTRTLATTVPRNRPITTPTSRAARIDQYQGQPWLVSRTVMMLAATPPVKPADRSISPSSSTKIRPMAVSVNCAPCWNMLAKLNREANRLLETATMMTTISRPRTAGSAPMPPPRTRAMYSRMYPPKVFSGAAVGSTPTGPGSAEPVAGGSAVTTRPPRPAAARCRRCGRP